MYDKSFIYANAPISPERAHSEWVLRGIRKFLLYEGAGTSEDIKICSRSLSLFVTRNKVAYIQGDDVVKAVQWPSGYDF
eukprot:4839312-Prorocentrum_lima.AAC.1